MTPGELKTAEGQAKVLDAAIAKLPVAKIPVDHLARLRRWVLASGRDTTRGWGLYQEIDRHLERWPADAILAADAAYVLVMKLKMAIALIPKNIA